MPPSAWPQVPQLRTTVTFGLSGLFDGLVHVRLSFDRLSFRRMQRALCDVVERQHACWIPPGDAQPQPQAGAGASGREAARAAQEQQDRQDRLLLQPTADEVAATVAGLQECGGQALNAEQRQAIAAVLCGAGRAHPYSLFGPPGAAGTCAAAPCSMACLNVLCSDAVQGGRKLPVTLPSGATHAFWCNPCLCQPPQSLQVPARR